MRIQCIIVVLLCTLISSAHAAPLTSHLATVRDRFVTAVIPTDAPQKQTLLTSARKLADTQSPDGSWPDVDYKNQDRSAWLTNKHLNNLLQMAKANSASPDPQLKAKLIAGIEWWVTHDPKNPNWWHNEIGVPQLLGETGMILGDDLPDAQRMRIVEIMKRSKWEKWTGQNLVWGVGIQVVRGILEHDEKTVADAYKRMYEEIRIESPTGEGIMPDFSFHQHGSQLYSGGYGLNFANDVGRFIAYSWGTNFQIPQDKLAIYTGFMLDGQQWMIRGATFDYSATGREITRKGKSATPRDWALGPVTPVGAGYGLANTVNRLAKLSVPRQEEFADFAWRLRVDGGPKPLSGNRYFWCSDYMTHQRPEFFVSVRMFSKRLINTELVNDEGKKSHHLADGCTLIYRTGDEYRDIFPVWDWNKIPGTTAEQTELVADRKSIQMKGTTDFVGGVSDGMYGVCVQDLARGALKARKFWMTFDDGFAALGAGINCESENAVITTINQRLAREARTEGDHSVKHAARSDDHSDDYVEHDGFTYVVPGSEQMMSHTARKTGRWSDIGTGSSDPVTMDVFNIWINHGKRPKDATYAYIVFAGTMHKSNVEIASNTPEMQAIVHHNPELLGVAFWKPGRLTAGARTVDVDQACLVMIRDGKVSVSNPKNSALKLILKVDGNPMQFELPGGPMAGSTVTKALP